MGIQICTGQIQTSELIGVENEIIKLMERYDAAGVSVAVVKDQDVIYSKGFGFRDLEKRLPVDDNTIFHIASMTKAFTGSLLGILESENQLSLKDRPGLYIPNFQFYNDKMNNLITIEDLLSHRSGLGNQGTSLTLFPENDKLKIVQRLKYLKPQAEVKNSWAYSNMGYTLAGVVVEQVIGKRWEAVVKEKIFEPLKMSSSMTTIEELMKMSNYALGYSLRNGNMIQVPFENYYGYSPAGAIKSSSKDLCNWMLAWLNKGFYEGTQVIPQEYVKKAMRLQNIKSDVYEKDAYLFGEGFGWRLRSYNGYFRVRHGGNTNGFSTVMDMFPFSNIGIVVLTNQSNSVLPYLISDHISRKLLKLPMDVDYPVNVGEMYTPNEEDNPINTDEKPTHPISDLLGRYHAKGYGTVEIKVENKLIYAHFPTYTFKLEHLNYNNFYLEGLQDFKASFNPEFTVEFVVDTEGKVERFKIYSQKVPVEFLKERK